MPTVDVAVPCYNYARFLRDAVESILTQSHRDLRVLIIDNGSTDGSHDVARRLAAEDDRVGLRSFARNAGRHAAYKAGVDWASGDYFFLLDADDLLTPGSLERGVAIMEQNAEIAFAYSAELLIGLDADDGNCSSPAPEQPAWRVISGETFIRQRCRDPRNTIGAPTVLRRTSAQTQAGPYRASLHHTDDLEMWLRLAMLGSVAEANLPQGIRRLHEAQASEPYRQVPVRDFVERVAAFESFFAHEGAAMPDARELLARARKTIGRDAFWCGRWRHREGDAANALRCIKYGLELNPVANTVRLLKWLLSPEVSVPESASYLSALVTGAGRRTERLIQTAVGRRNAHRHPAE